MTFFELGKKVNIAVIRILSTFRKSEFPMFKKRVHVTLQMVNIGQRPVLIVTYIVSLMNKSAYELKHQSQKLQPL